jgi:hypothetical protein|tara:strand:- start:1020 stop:1874 length:855 start_codon:yes stop_codon:yes gene_type:complete
MSQQIIITKEQLERIGGVLEEQSGGVRAYSFDWDDNILKMPTTIKMLKKTDSGWEPILVGTEEFALVRDSEDYKLDNGAFDNFIEEGAFLTDLEKALNSGSFAPSFDKFKEALIYANPISIITARGHNPRALRKGMDLVISHTFNEDELGRMIDNIKQTYPELDGQEPEMVLKTYLDSHEYHPVTSKIFTDKFGLESGSAANPEENKKIALRDYVANIVAKASSMVNLGNEKLSVGFSDDDLGNINAIIPFIKEVLQVEFPDVDFIVYDTSEGGMNKIVLKQVN